MRPRVLLLLIPAVSAAAVNDTLLWGPYRPNLYFGLRPRLPQSLMTGLMWFGTQDYASLQRRCEQNDKLDSYSWTEYDTRQGGVQVIKDSHNNVKITTEFLKIAGGDHGGSWAARIKGEPIDAGKISHISTIFYFGLEGMGGLEMETDEDENGIEGPIKLSGNTPDLEDFLLRIVDGPNNQFVDSGRHASDFEDRIGKTHYIGRRLLEGDTWQAKEHILKEIVERAREAATPYRDPEVGLPHPSWILQLPDDVYTGSNLFAYQKSFSGPFQFDVFYESASAKQKLTSATLDQGVPALVEAYGKRFTEVFPYPADFPSQDKEKLEQFSKDVTSNLFGGVGYFYGNSIVNKKFSYEWDEDEDSVSDEDDEEKGVSSQEDSTGMKDFIFSISDNGTTTLGDFRFSYPDYESHVRSSLEILKSWIDLIDDDGWVAREQILGEEARSKVPQEFQTQVPNYANPPTLTMAVTAFIDRLKQISSKRELSDQDLGIDLGVGTAQATFSADTSPTAGVESQYLNNPELAISFLKSIYEPLKRHYDWFRRTQRGQIKQYGRKARSRTEGYRWRGRSEQHVLTSGMDDYPRGPPHAGELHLDLISWMAFFSRTMRDIANFVGETEDAITFTEIEKAILDNIEDLHWNEEEKMYCDANINEEEESYHICHRGYLSLFPFLLELLPADSPHLSAILDLLHDPEHLWSPFGLRSLSKSHPEFGQGENYWKGPIWIQMNYLALRALHNTYATREGPYQQRAKNIYDELRKNVVNNVFKEYERTGYVWEQYDPVTGEGKRRLDVVDCTHFFLSRSMHFGRTSQGSGKGLMEGPQNQHGRAYGNGNTASHAASEPFRLVTWLRLHGVDLITMLFMGMIGLGVYFASPAPNRSFPVYFQNGEVVFPQFAYPLRKAIIPIWAAALIAFIVPFFFFCLFQIRRRSLNDFLTTTMGLLKSLITAAVFQVFVKWLIGGLRPHFLAVCQPNVSQGSTASGNGFASIMYDRSVCTGDKNLIDDSLESMPSGHSTAAWAGLLFLSLYFNAQLKVISAHNPAYWKMILFFAPILGASLISGSLTIDEFHNWYDVLAGAFIGSACALVAFRQTFASTFDFRFNHLLLPRSTSLFHRRPFMSASGAGGPYYDYQLNRPELASNELPFTREGGWGYEFAATGVLPAATAVGAWVQPMA
ncbi:hypothetical protein NP233_g2589 [Leucocoprinus birnbaumii]|uniref:Mannosyl-oligosaccharide glucosidase n=1 Tax=Leucocoprinus birnbaumii TaxID=56174 RepID=A0AAD5YTK9_9AGAR|nr:hypothetical protein NP233_g2589 [Leucocoprinus birnbaumii]